MPRTTVQDMRMLLIEVFATAIMETKDETGDFASEAKGLALDFFNITSWELDAMIQRLTDLTS